MQQQPPSYGSLAEESGELTPLVSVVAGSSSSSAESGNKKNAASADTERRMFKGTFKGIESGDFGELLIEALTSTLSSSDVGPDEHAGGLALESFFDLTRPRLLHIFRKLARDPSSEPVRRRSRSRSDSLDIVGDSGSEGSADMVLSYGNFRRGLLGIGVRIEHDESFRRLVENVDADGSGDITFEEFDDVVKSVKLTLLFDSKYNKMVPGPRGRIVDRSALFLECLDYDSARYAFESPLKNVRAWMFSPPPAWARMRWINVTRRDPVTLKRLAVKYCLHPLALEHMLEQNRARDKARFPRVVRYEDHLCTYFPCVSVSFRDPIFVAGSEDDGNKPLSLSIVRLKVEMISIFVSLPLTRTVISVCEADRIRSLDSDVFRRVRRGLTVGYSKLRQHNGMHVLYAILEVLTDRLCDAVSVLDREMTQVRDIIRGKRIRTKFDGMKVISNLEHELRSMQLMLSSGTRAIASILDHNDVLGKSGLQSYIRDIHVRLLQASDETQSLMQWCHRLREESDRNLTERQNNVLYALTIVTTLFLPGEFLAAVFGMNFYNMPLIHYKYGYPLFWGSVVLSWIALAWFFRRKKLM